MKDYVRCHECNYEGGRSTPYADIKVDIKPFGATEAVKSVEEGLSKYFQTETMDGENQYFCEKCNKKTDATKGMALKTVPYILSLQLKRFTYDWELDRRIKLDNEVSFPLTLDVAPYKKNLAKITLKRNPYWSYLNDIYY